MKDYLQCYQELKDHCPFAWQQFMEETRPYLLRCAMSMDSRNAEDAVQSVYLYLWQTISTMTELNNSFLFTNLRWGLARIWKKQMNIASLTGVDEMPDSGQNEGGAAVERAETVSWVRKALEELPEKHLLPLQMRMEGMSYLEIAEALNVSLATVQGRLRQGRQWLRERLGPEYAST